MEKLEKGKFFGSSTNEFYINGLTIVNSKFYHFTSCPWHYHHNAHFAFTTRGSLTETHKKNKLHLSAGNLMYNHSQEPHCNSHYSEIVEALHIDIDDAWFRQYNLNFRQIEGIQQIKNPVQKIIFHNLLKEIKDFDIISTLAIEAMVLQSVSELIRTQELLTMTIPTWVSKLRDLLYDRYDESLSLQEVALEVNLHPVYLCQKFPFYFNCTFGDYIRKIRVAKAIELMLAKDLSLTEIAYDCGFSDQSHFIRLFKKHINLSPAVFRKLITRT